MASIKQMFILPEDKEKLLKELTDNNINVSVLDTSLKRIKKHLTNHIDIRYRDGGTDSFSTVYKPMAIPYSNSESNTTNECINLIRVDDVIYLIDDSIIKEMTVSQIPF